MKYKYSKVQEYYDQFSTVTRATTSKLMLRDLLTAMLFPTSYILAQCTNHYSHACTFSQANVDCMGQSSLEGTIYVYTMRPVQGHCCEYKGNET